MHFNGSHLLLGNRKIRLFLVKSVLTRQQNQGTVFQTVTIIYFINPETSSRVTLATLGIGFQPKLPTTNNQQPNTKATDNQQRTTR